MLLGGLFYLIIIFLSKFSHLRIPNNYFVIFTLFYFYYFIFLKTFGMTIRALKDVLIGSTVDVLLFLLLLIYILGRKVPIDKFSEFLAKFIVIFSLFSSILGLMLFFGFIEGNVGPFPLFQNPSFDNRLHGILGDPTHFGSVMGFGIICANFLMYFNKQKKYLFIILYLMIILIMSGSRNSIVSLLFSLFALLILKISIRKLITVFITMSVIFLSLFICFTEFYSEVSIYLQSVLHIETFTRIEIWLKVIDIFSNGSILEILFGHGYGYLRGIFRSAHSSYLEYLVDYGLVFIMAFLIYTSYLIWKLIYTLQKEPSHQSATLALGLLTYCLVFSMFLVTIFTEFFHFVNFIFLCSILIISFLKINLSENNSIIHIPKKLGNTFSTHPI